MEIIVSHYLPAIFSFSIYSPLCFPIICTMYVCACIALSMYSLQYLTFFNSKLFPTTHKPSSTHSSLALIGFGLWQIYMLWWNFSLNLANMVVSNFFGILLVMEVMVFYGLRLGVHGLSMDYYMMNCPIAEFIVRDSVTSALQSDPTLAAGLVRMHFHDCFIQVPSSLFFKI